MPEWLVERGIGETRAVLIDNGEIVEARIEIEGALPAGSVVKARLVQTGRSGRNAVAVDAHGAEYLLPRGAPGMSEGAALNIEITRPAIAGIEPWKRPLARVTDRPPASVPPLASSLDGRALSLPASHDTLGEVGWDELLERARSGVVEFSGGELRIFVTPAMTLIDVDGFLDPDELATVGAAEAAKAIRQLDIGGSIGVDLPTTRSKAARQQAASALDEHLPQPFERTAVNGFGFVQIVRPRVRASLIELAVDRAAFEARALLRRLAFGAPGRTRLVAHPAVASVLDSKAEWLEALARQIGGSVDLRVDPAVPMSGAYAEPA